MSVQFKKENNGLDAIITVMLFFIIGYVLAKNILLL